MSDARNPFLSADSASTYVRDTPRKVPGLSDLHRMTTLLLDERAPAAADVLVVGAGGGLEMKALAEARPNWRLLGVDPSPAMLDMARQMTSAYAERTDFVLGTACDAPAGPFDGAVCLLTLHFLERQERVQTLQAIRERLKPGAVFVAAHHVAFDGQAERWLTGSAAFAGDTNPDYQQAKTSAHMMAERLPLLSVSQEEACFRQAGFSEPALFYAAFSFRGWVMTA